MAVEGQTEGSISMGQGQVLYEEVIVEKGRIFNPSFLTYGLPTSMETADIKSIIVESENPDDPFAPKEAGEGMQVPTPAAIANAVYDAAWHVVWKDIEESSPSCQDPKHRRKQG